MSVPLSWRRLLPMTYTRRLDGYLLLVWRIKKRSVRYGWAAFRICDDGRLSMANRGREDTARDARLSAVAFVRGGDRR